MREDGPGAGDRGAALGGVLARSLTDEHFEAYKRAKLDGIDVGGGEEAVPRLSAATSTSAWTWRAASSPSRSAAARWRDPIPSTRWCALGIPSASRWSSPNPS